LTKTLTAVNPHPECTVSCEVDLDTITANDDGNSVNISGTLSENNLYTCTIAGLSGIVGHNDQTESFSPVT
jgi:hypothetical protein